MNSHNPVSKCAADQGIVPLTREKNDELYQQLHETTGDEQEAIIQTMIEGNMALVFGRVSDFIDDFPKFKYLRDDLISECFLALTRAVRALATFDPSDTPNPLGFIYRNLYNAIIDFAFSEGTLSVTRFIQWYYRKLHGEPLKLLKVDPLLAANEPVNMDAIHKEDFMETLEELCETDDERKILHWRVEGYTHSEIANKLNVCRLAIQRALKTIHQRYQNSLEDV